MEARAHTIPLALEICGVMVIRGTMELCSFWSLLEKP